jgi:hypothetical protein
MSPRDDQDRRQSTVPHSHRYSKFIAENQKSASMERDLNFQKDISDTLHNIKRFRNYKDRTWGRLQEMHQ